MLPPDSGEALKKQRVVIADQTKVPRTRIALQDTMSIMGSIEMC
jgi:hypothetical protein